MIKAIFFDVDGTLISNKSSHISESVIKALNNLRNQGIKLFIATGRHYLELDELKINDQFKFDGYLTLNGCYCFNEIETIYSNPIDKEDIVEIIDYVTKNNISCCFIEKETMYINLIDKLVVDSQKFLNTSIPPVKNINRAFEHEVYQFNPFVPINKMKDIMMLAKNCKYTQWYDYGYDVIANHGGKQEGIKAMMAYYNLKVEEVMAFGDGQNDIEMLSLVGIGICMGNGHQDVKAVSDFVTKSVCEDGIVYALDCFGLI